MDGERIHYHTRIWSKKHNRHTQFWFNAYKPGTNVWRCHMNADYVASEYTTTEYPHVVMLKWLKDWMKELV